MMMVPNIASFIYIIPSPIICGGVEMGVACYCIHQNRVRAWSACKIVCARVQNEPHE